MAKITIKIKNKYSFEMSKDWALSIRDLYPENKAYESFVRGVQNLCPIEVSEACSKLKAYEDGEVYYFKPLLGDSFFVTNAMVAYGVFQDLFKKEMEKEDIFRNKWWCITSNTKLMDLINKELNDIRIVLIITVIPTIRNANFRYPLSICLKLKVTVHVIDMLSDTGLRNIQDLRSLQFK